MSSSAWMLSVSRLAEKPMCRLIVSSANLQVPCTEKTDTPPCSSSMLTAGLPARTSIEEPSAREVN